MTKNGNENKSDTVVPSHNQVALELVKEASQLASVPVLQSAASLALEITTLSQAFKEDDIQCSSLAIYTVDFVAIIWHFYQQYPDSTRAKWLSHGLRDVLDELVITFRGVAHVFNELKLNITDRTSADRPTELRAYRERIREIAEKYEIVSTALVEENEASPLESKAFSSARQAPMYQKLLRCCHCGFLGSHAAFCLFR